jgi:S1-C subfamily serine protease
MDKRLKPSVCVFLIIFSAGVLIKSPELFAAPQQPEVSLTNAVVKVFVTSNQMDYYRPWQSKGIDAGGGSGAIIQGQRILTNAHVVADHTFIQVKKDADPQKYTAEVIAVGHDCDLALLKVHDPQFFEDVTPLEFGELPKQKDNVTVIGHPQGGGKISITEGVVSRVEVTSYAQSSRQLLTVQVDAAVNPGNSGGPVFNRKGEVIGILSTKETQAEGVVFAIQSKYIIQAVNELKRDDTTIHDLKLPSNSSVKGMDQQQQVKKLQDFVFMVKVY